MDVMDAPELRRLRKAADLTQAELAAKLGVHRDFIGLMERGKQPITERTALAVTAIGASREAIAEANATPEDLPPLMTTDPLERIVERALQRAKIRYVPDRDGKVPENLDFHLPDLGVFVEVKAMHTPRISDQMARAPNVIALQGEAAVRFFADVVERQAKR